MKYRGHSPGEGRTKYGERELSWQPLGLIHEDFVFMRDGYLGRAPCTRWFMLEKKIASRLIHYSYCFNRR